jgi:hypothetical protein
VETPERNLDSATPLRGASLPWLVLSWLWVCLPLGWGIWQTALKSLPLFDSFLHAGKP